MQTIQFHIDDKCPTSILRGTWFREGYSGTLEPFDDESMAERLEAEYNTWHLKTYQSPRKSMYSKNDVFAKSQSDSLLHSALNAPVLHSPDTIESVSETLTQTPESSFCENFPSVNGSDLDDNLSAPTALKKRVPYQTIRFTDCHIDWYGEDELYLYYESTSLYIRQKLGMQKVGTRLFRGFTEPASAEDKFPDISHLCFVVHGIGQKMGINPILKNCNELRNACDKIKARYFSHLDEENQRVEFLPVEWRTSLQLDGRTVESITPVHVRSLRTVLNSSAMDIMYYTSPLYRAEIMSSLKAELNRLYDMFRRLNPNFESRGGKVSVIAHSLGCVLIYDLITGWNQLLDNDELAEILLDKSNDRKDISSNMNSLANLDARNNSGVMCQDQEDNVVSSSGNLKQVTRVSFQLDAAKILVNNLEQELNRLLVTRRNLKSNNAHKSNVGDNSNQSADLSMCPPGSSLFQPSSLLFAHNLENFFCLGSPLGVYLVLRGIRPGPYQNQDTILPRKICSRIFNIYHPADPVAYRLEPLILKYYSNVQPAMIHRVDAISRPCYDSLPLIACSGKEFKHQKSEDCTSKSASDTNQLLAAPDTCTDSSRRLSIASRLFGFLSRASSYSSTQETETIGFSPPKDGFDHGTSKTDGPPTFELLSDDEEKINSMPEDTTSYSPTNKNETNNTTSTTNSTDIFVNDDLCLESLQLEHRLDFELRSSRYENMYISLLTSHTSYWTNPDICMFVMTHLFPEKSNSTG
ncbi:unnamed protein product [Trichobilharzia szidati]|nr:unnamed protein product [Trichobilharzia szidati]